MADSKRNSPVPYIVGFGVFVAVAIGIFIAMRSSPASPESEREAVTVAQWGQERYLIYLPLYVAMERGYFDDEGLDISLTFTGNDDQTFAAVVSGSAQFGIGDPGFAAISQERGLPARVIALVVGRVAIWGVTADTSLRPLTSPADLAGLRIGTFPSPSTNYTLIRELINTFPENLEAPKIIQAPIGGQLALLEGNSADIAMVLEPAASVAEDQGYRVVYSSAQFHGPYAFTGVTTTADFLQANTGTAQRFVIALERALRACHDDPTIATDVATSLFPTLSPKVIASAVERMLQDQTIPRTAAVSEAAWNNLLKTRVTAGDLDAFPTDNSTVDNTFAETAARRVEGDD